MTAAEFKKKWARYQGKETSAYLRDNVKSERQGNRDVRLAKYWWLHRRSAEDMREATKGHARFIVTPSVAKHRTFFWVSHPLLPDHQLNVFASSKEFFFGILHSRIHEIWSLAQGTQLREKESGFRYTPTTCFETFPFPFPDDLQPPIDACEESLPPHAEANPSLVTSPPSTDASSRRRLQGEIAAAAKELNELRERWLNPPEWTRTEYLEFPASVDGPWARYLVDPLPSAGESPQRRVGGPGLQNRPRPLPATRAQGRRLRRQAEKAHAHESLQRTPRLA
jgi:hypothetical protein